LGHFFKTKFIASNTIIRRAAWRDVPRIVLPAVVQAVETYAAESQKTDTAIRATAFNQGGVEIFGVDQPVVPPEYLFVAENSLKADKAGGDTRLPILKVRCSAFIITS